VEEVRRLRAAVNYAEDQYRSLQEKHEDQVAVWERQCEAVRLQHSQLRDSRLSAEYELDSKEAAVCVLREENVELQRIFSV
jgi:ABC-type phosphate transport system auxiliary subunit